MSRASNAAIAQGFSQGLMNFTKGYTERKDTEIYSKQLADENATPLQKATAFAQLSRVNPHAAQNYVANKKMEMQQSALQRLKQKEDLILGNVSQGVGGPQQATRNATNPQQLANVPEQFMNPEAFAQPNEGMGQNAPPVANAQGQPPQQQLAPEEKVEALRNLASEAENENLHNQAADLRSRADAAQRDIISRKKEENQITQFQLKQKNDIHKQSKEEFNKIEKDYDSAKTRLNSFNIMKQKLNSKNLDPKSFTNLLRKSLENTRWKDFFLNPDQAEFQAAALDTYEGMKELFGVRLSDADLAQASGKIPSIDKTPQANEAIINFHELKDKMKVEKLKIADEIIEENGGFRPIDFTSQVRKRLQERFGDEAKKITRLAAYDGEIGPKFDITNQAHKARRDEILQSVNGDRAKATQLLSQEFVQ